MFQSEDLASTPPDVVESAHKITLNLLPPKSREIYECAYNRFLQWCKEKNIKVYSESVLLAYFGNLATKMKCSTLWSQYSMVKATLNLNNSVDIGTFSKLRLFLKRQNDNYTPKKSRVLTKEQIDKFLNYAPDNTYLMIKVVLILGISGACRCDELVRLKIDDIEDVKSALLVKIPNTKTNKSRSFTVMGENYLSFYRKYVAFRPKNIAERRLFLRFQNGRCYRVVVGIHKISSVAQEVAKYLNLENSSEYTGHCLRRTSATLLVDSGGDLTCLKRHGGWKSSSVAEGYIEDSIENKKEIAKKILRLDEPSTSKGIISSIRDDNTSQKNEEALDDQAQEILRSQDSSANITLTDIVSKSTKNVNSVETSGLFNFYQSCSSCTFNITVNKQ